MNEQYESDQDAMDAEAEETEEEHAAREEAEQNNYDALLGEGMES